jgi:hypothetical protein
MKYTVQVELTVEIDFFEKDELDEIEQEEINDIIIDTFSDNSMEIIQNIFKEMEERTNIEIRNAFTFNENIED